MVNLPLLCLSASVLTLALCVATTNMEDAQYRTKSAESSLIRRELHDHLNHKNASVSPKKTLKQDMAVQSLAPAVSHAARNKQRSEQHHEKLSRSDSEELGVQSKSGSRSPGKQSLGTEQPSAGEIDHEKIGDRVLKTSSSRISPESNFTLGKHRTKMEYASSLSEGAHKRQKVAASGSGPIYMPDEKCGASLVQRTASPYIYSTKAEAEDACTKAPPDGRGCTKLCAKSDLDGNARCAAGWLSDGCGYWMDVTANGCGSAGFNNWNGNAGAYCCDCNDCPSAGGSGGSDGGSDGSVGAQSKENGTNKIGVSIHVLLFSFSIRYLTPWRMGL